MMKEGGFGEAFDTFGDIFRKNKTIVTTSVFVGLTTWLMLSSFNYIAERNNPDMVWVVSSPWVLLSLSAVVVVVVMMRRLLLTVVLSSPRCC